MATFQTYNGNGSTKAFAFTFPYINTTDVKASIGGVATTAYSVSGSTLTFSTAPPSGTGNVKISRDTNNASIEANFQSGSALRAVDFNDNFTQLLYVTQESTDISDTATTNAANSVITSNAAVATANTASASATTAVNTANTANTTAASAVTTANAATTTANGAVTTANTAATNATTAISTANGAVTKADTALANAATAITTANSAVTTSNTANTTAGSAVTTANGAVTTANTANTNATAAVNSANAANAAVASAVLFTLIANVAAIPGSPSNNDYIEIGNSTGIQSFSPLSGLPSGFVGATGLTVRLRYATSGSTWVFMSYFANDSETRYLTKNLPVVTGDSTNGSGQITLNCENNSHGIKIKGPPHSAAATYTLTLPNNTGTNGQFLATNGSGVMSWSTMTQILVADGGNFDSGASLVTSSSTFDGGSF